MGTPIRLRLRICHVGGIVNNKHARIGTYCTLRQNTTIGAASLYISMMTLGDHMSVGANVCIIGDNLHIGHNITIGAAAFINKSLPDNSMCYSQHHLLIHKKKSKQQTL